VRKKKAMRGKKSFFVLFLAFFSVPKKNASQKLSPFFFGEKNEEYYSGSPWTGSVIHM
jgi:hypothetical protein